MLILNGRPNVLLDIKGPLIWIDLWQARLRGRTGRNNSKDGGKEATGSYSKSGAFICSRPRQCQTHQFLGLWLRSCVEEATFSKTCAFLCSRLETTLLPNAPVSTLFCCLDHVEKKQPAFIPKSCAFISHIKSNPTQCAPSPPKSVQT